MSGAQKKFSVAAAAADQQTDFTAAGINSGMTFETGLIHSMILICRRDASHIKCASTTEDESNFLHPNHATVEQPQLQIPEQPAVNGQLLDVFETKLRQLGEEGEDEENAERCVTGILCQYNSNFVAYLESDEVGLMQSVLHAQELIEDRSGGMDKIKIVFVTYNLKERTFNCLSSRRYDPTQLSHKGPSPLGSSGGSPILARSPSPAGTSINSNRDLAPRALMVKVMLQLVLLIRKQLASHSIKKTLDLIGEKFLSSLPEPSMIDTLLVDETLSESMEYYPGVEATKFVKSAAALQEDIVWPAPSETFQLQVKLDQTQH